MRRHFTSLRGMTALGAASLISALFTAAPVQAHHGGHGGGGGAGVHHGGVYGGAHHYGLGGFYGHGYPGLYRHNFYGPGFYRPYYGYGLGLGGFGLGYGLGAGLGGFGFGGYGLGGYGLGGYGLGGYGLGGYGLGGYGSGGYGLGGYGMGGYGGHVPYSGGAAYPIAAGMPQGQTPPPPDNAAHLQLVVPPNAEVRIDGYKTNQTGTVREFFSPPLTAGTNYTYSISVRYTDAAGKAIDDARTIYVRANDWFRIDFTKPPPQETPRQP